MRGCFFAVMACLASCAKDAVVAPIEEKGQVLFLSRRIPNSSDWQLTALDK